MAGKNLDLEGDGEGIAESAPWLTGLLITGAVVAYALLIALLGSVNESSFFLLFGIGMACSIGSVAVGGAWFVRSIKEGQSWSNAGSVLMTLIGLFLIAFPIWWLVYLLTEGTR